MVLEHRLGDEVAELRRLAAAAPVVLLDYETSTDVGDPARPLSHGWLVAAYAAGT
jgi:hypothetical protein